MAIVSIREGYSKHSAGGEVDSKTSVRCFSLTTDNVADDARFVWPQSDPVDATIIIPAPGTYYPGDTDIRSREPQVKKISPTFFNIEVNYGKDVTSTGERKEDGAANPLAKPAEENWDSNIITLPMSQDINGVPYVNIFAEPVIGMERDFADEVLYLTRNEAAFNEYNAHAWLHTVYDGVFRGTDRGRVLMKRIRVEHIKDEVDDSSTFGEILYSRVAYEIHFRHRNVPLINAYELKRYGTTKMMVFVAIDDNEANQSKHAWYHRRLHTAKHFVDDNSEVCETPNNEDMPVGVEDKLLVLTNYIPDFVFQQEFGFATWGGVA